MFLNKLFGPQIVFGSGGGGGSGGSSSSSSSSRSKPSPTPKGRNRDADMFAGSKYKASTSSKSSNSGKGSSPTSVTAKDLKSGNVTTYKNKTGGGSVTVKRGTKLADVPTVNVGVNGGKTRPNSDVYGSKDVAAPKPTEPVGTGSSAPVTAPDRIDPTDGVGGGRDGGGSAKRKASQTQEDNIAIKRAAEGVDGYKRKRVAKNATAKAKANPMAIRKT